MVKTSCVLAPHLATARKGEDIEGDMTERGNRAQAEPGSRQASRTPSPSNKLQLKGQTDELFIIQGTAKANIGLRSRLAILKCFRWGVKRGMAALCSSIATRAHESVYVQAPNL